MYGLILAGGSGSRLWPLSRELYPKQLLNLNMEKSLLQASFERLACFTPSENIIAITNAKHLSNVRYQMQSMSKNLMFWQNLLLKIQHLQLQLQQNI